MRILQLNTHLFIDTLAGLVPSQVFDDSDRRDVIIQNLLKVDVECVGLSEVWANKSKNLIISGVASKFPYSAWDNNSNRLEIGSGLLLLSKYPLQNIEFHRYSDLVGPDHLSQKGFLSAEMEHPTTPIQIIVTHTQADNDQAAIHARKENITQLVNGLQAVGGNLPMALLGDLNIAGEDEAGKPTDEYQELIKALSQCGLDDCFRRYAPDPKRNPGVTYDAVNNKLIWRFAPDDRVQKIQQRIDYVFARGASTTLAEIPITQFSFQELLVTYDLSDHYPLVVDLKF
jgi:endonuclease/exonuclease/phosphatase family metal-dependent hydrolase